MASRRGSVVKTVTDFIFLGSRITADDCSYEIKKPLLLGRKAMTKLHSVLKNRDITLPAKVCIVRAMVFPGVMYRCASWTIKETECQRIDAFKLWCWRRWESLGLQGDQPSQSWRKSVLNIHWEDWYWGWSSNTLATWWEESIHWKRPYARRDRRQKKKEVVEDEMVR